MLTRLPTNLAVNYPGREPYSELCDRRDTGFAEKPDLPRSFFFFFDIGRIARSDIQSRRPVVISRLQLSTYMRNAVHKSSTSVLSLLCLVLLSHIGNKDAGSDVTGVASPNHVRGYSHRLDYKTPDGSCIM